MRMAAHWVHNCHVTDTAAAAPVGSHLETEVMQTAQERRGSQVSYTLGKIIHSHIRIVFWVVLSILTERKKEKI